MPEHLNTLLATPVTDAISVPMTDTTLIGTTDTTLVTTAQLWDAAAVYGSESTPLSGGVAEVFAEQSTLSGNIWFQLLLLTAFGIYCFMIYNYREQVVICVKGLVNFKAEDKFTLEHGHLYSSFIRFAVIMCVIMIGVGVTKIIAVKVEHSVISTLPQWIIPMMSLLLWTLVSVVLLFQTTVLKVVGEVTFSSKFIDALSEIKYMYMAAGALFTTLPILLYTGFNPVWDTVMAYIGITAIIILIGVFIFQTFLLFIRQKISLLVWILYLCAVEIFPLAMISVLLVKNL